MKKTTALLLAAGFMLMATSQVQASDKVIAGKTIATAPVIAPSPVIAGESTNIHGHASATYTDLSGHFSAHSVQRLTDMGLLPSGTTFQPNEKMDRNDLKAWIQKVAGVQVKDTNASAQTVTRLEVAQWLAESLPPMNTGITGKGMSVNPYDDTPNITTEQRDALILMYNLGIMVGDGHRHFSPDATLTRGEAAVLLDKANARTLTVGTKVDYEKLTGTLPESANTMYDKNKSEPGLYNVTDNGIRYVMIAAGEVPTGGYSVSIDSVTQTDAGIFVHASLHEPAPGTMVPQMVNYPSATMKLTDLNKPIYLIED